MEESRTICWFSCGAPSTIATILTLREYPDALVVYVDTGSEHLDNKRYIKDVENLIGKSVTILKSSNYKNHFDVIEKERYIRGVAGARCTKELKIKPRLKFQEDDDLHVFGYTADEVERACKFDANFDIDTWYPLIESGYTNDQCRGMLMKLGLKIPTMYEMGYHNNNCIGCVKGGRGYWNKIRRDFPEVFNRMARLERELSRTCIRKQIKCPECKGLKPSCDICNKKGEISVSVYLDELDPNAGNHKDTIIQCDFICYLADIG